MPLLLLMLGRAVFASQTLSILQAQPCCLLPTDGASKALHCPPVKTQPSFEVISVQTWLDLMVLLGFWRDTSWCLRWIFCFYVTPATFSSPKIMVCSNDVMCGECYGGKEEKKPLLLILQNIWGLRWFSFCPMRLMLGRKSNRFLNSTERICRVGQLSVDLAMRWSWSEYQDFLSYTTHISTDASHLKVITRSEMGAFLCACSPWW